MLDMLDIEDQLFHWMASVTNLLKKDAADAYIKLALLLLKAQNIDCRHCIPVFVDVSKKTAVFPLFATKMYEAHKESFENEIGNLHQGIHKYLFCQVDEECVFDDHNFKSYVLTDSIKLSFLSTSDHWLHYLKLEQEPHNTQHRNTPPTEMFGKIPIFLNWVHISRTHVHNLIHHIEDGIVLITKHRHIALMNAAAKTLLGIPHNLALGQISNFIISIFSGLLEEVDHSHAMVSKEFPLSQPVERVLKIDVTPMVESQEYAVLMRDISQYKEVDRMKTEIITTVSHELRTPLTAIDSLSRNLIRGIAGELPEKANVYLERIQSNTSRLTNLINNLLDLSKLEAGESPLKRCFMPIKPMLDNLLFSLEGRAEEKKIHLSLNLKINAKECFLADLPKWDQVMMNLLGNAIKFSPQNGIVKLTVEKNKTHFVFTVSDMGPGIPESEKRNIFQKFKQVGREYGAGEKGTGLGLSIVKEILNMHEARIHVESPPKHHLQHPTGSEFIVELPRYSEKMTFEHILKDHIQLMHENQGCHVVVHLKLQKKELLDVLTEPVDNVLAGIRGVIKKSTDDLIFFQNARKIFLIVQTDDETILQLVLKRIYKVVKDKNFKGRFTKRCFPYVLLKPGIQSFEREQVLNKMWEVHE